MRARTMTLPERLDHTAAKPLAEALLAKRGGPLDLRVGRLERVATAPLQVLLSTAATWRADGHRLRLSGRSPVLEDALQALGLTLDTLTAEGNVP
jgi:chemotaxis protein CheX